MTDVFSHVEVVDGRVWMKPDGIATFAGDLPEQEQKVVWATHAAPAADLFTQKVEGTAWNSKPSWYIVANKDRTVQPRAATLRREAHGRDHFRDQQQPLRITSSTKPGWESIGTWPRRRSRTLKTLRKVSTVIAFQLYRAVEDWSALPGGRVPAWLEGRAYDPRFPVGDELEIRPPGNFRNAAELSPRTASSDPRSGGLHGEPGDRPPEV
ncbi:MAG TPA: hypothetical protein VF908_04785 [Gemmatimonadaceae bacterium]